MSLEEGWMVVTTYQGEINWYMKPPIEWNTSQYTLVHLWVFEMAGRHGGQSFLS